MSKDNLMSLLRGKWTGGTCSPPSTRASKRMSRKHRKTPSGLPVNESSANTQKTGKPSLFESAGTDQWHKSAIRRTRPRSLHLYLRTRASKALPSKKRSFSSSFRGNWENSKTKSLPPPSVDLDLMCDTMARLSPSKQTTAMTLTPSRSIAPSNSSWRKELQMPRH